jgi:WS/DGAT/MGAT family acyltransferase
VVVHRHSKKECHTMQRLSGLDTAFLCLETPNAPMNVVGTILVEPSAGDGSFSVERILRLIEGRLHRLPPLRRRLLEVPFGLDHPVWIEDRKVVVADHVERIQAAPPGSERILAEIVGRFAARPLDRSRPLWEVAFVEGLAEGRSALVFKVHHAAADGVAAAQMMLQLLDTSAEPSPEPASIPDRARVRAPRRARLLVQALAGLTLRPARVARLVGAAAQAGARLGGEALAPSAGPTLPALPLAAPRTAFNGAVSTRRRVAYARASLRDLRFVQSAFETTANDVILAASTAALRHYLEAHGDRPREPLVAAVPVCVRDRKDWNAHGNHISTLFVHLPVQLADPLDRLLAVRAHTRQAKRFHAALGGRALRDWAQLTLPALLARAARLYSHFELADRHRPLYNLVISNVPGPRAPLYAAGARVVAAHAHGPIFDGAGLNVTVMTYADSVEFGVLACERSVPDVEEIALGFGAAVGELVKLALEVTPTPRPRRRARPRRAP